MTIYEMPSYEVYIKIDEQNSVIAINSSAFVYDPREWIKIDEGVGDKYRHAQGNYFPMPLFDENGAYNYKYEDDKAVLRTEEEKETELAPIRAEQEIKELKKKLSDTDYVAAKIAEGAADVEEYKETIRQRAEWRARINELEGFVNNV